LLDDGKIRGPEPLSLVTSVPDPDPQVFGPSGYRSICQRYGSRSFYQQAEIVRKTWIPIVLWLLFDFLSLKNYVKVISRKISFLFAS
jgi:hypothetical protein